MVLARTSHKKYLPLLRVLSLPGETNVSPELLPSNGCRISVCLHSCYLAVGLYVTVWWIWGYHGSWYGSTVFWFGDSLTFRSNISPQFSGSQRNPYKQEWLAARFHWNVASAHDGNRKQYGADSGHHTGLQNGVTSDCLENVGASTSHKPLGLHDLLQLLQLYLLFPSHK
jgi:hypothetical protein